MIMSEGWKRWLWLVSHQAVKILESKDGETNTKLFI